MLRNRIIPILLIKNKELYKTVNFEKSRYLGDPINGIKLFNGKEVDELVILNISDQQPIDFEYISKLVSECFMPVCYGGQIRTQSDIDKLFRLGIDKISFNFSAVHNKEVIKNAIKTYGAQSIVVSIDVKLVKSNYYVFLNHGKNNTRLSLEKHLKEVQDLGIGEIMLTSIDREGTMAGYDYKLLEIATKHIYIPFIFNGGASSTSDLKRAIDQGAYAVGAGSLFSYYGKKRAVMINYLDSDELILFDPIKKD
jgi:cyclase